MSDEDRQGWRWANRPPNRAMIRHSKVFGPGNTLRCPHVRELATGRLEICGHCVGAAPYWVREAIVRSVQGLEPIPHSEHQSRTCGSCRKMVDIYLVRHQELEATG